MSPGVSEKLWCLLCKQKREGSRNWRKWRHLYRKPVAKQKGKSTCTPRMRRSRKTGAEEETLSPYWVDKVINANFIEKHRDQLSNYTNLENLYLYWIWMWRHRICQTRIGCGWGKTIGFFKETLSVTVRHIFGISYVPSLYSGPRFWREFRVQRKYFSCHNARKRVLWAQHNSCD